MNQLQIVMRPIFPVIHITGTILPKRTQSPQRYIIVYYINFWMENAYESPAHQTSNKNWHKTTVRSVLLIAGLFFK